MTSPASAVAAPGESAWPPRWLRTTLFVCFYLSGAAGLIYQIAWIKALGLVFGRTTYAITAVLGAFMAGLALGSWLLGRAGDRSRRPLALYGWIELGIGLTGLGSLGLIWLIRQSHAPMYHLLGGQMLALMAYRFLASFLGLLIPTTLMGGTYPVVVRYLTRRTEQLAGFASRLYWLNTAGAITGACLAGFVLLWHVGLERTFFIAVALNLTAAALVLASSVRLGKADEVAPAAEPEPEPEADPAPPGDRLILLVAGTAGLTGMMFEISWTRILAIFLGSTTYAFTLMLATFLLGITLGSYLFERWHRRWRLGPLLLGKMLVLLVLGSLLFVALGSELAELTRQLALLAGGSGVYLLFSQFVVSVLAMIFPTILFGLVFPLTVVLYCGPDRRRGTRTGVLYAVNTLGAIVGAFLTGLFLVTALNSVNTSLTASGLLAAVATAVFLRERRGEAVRSAVVSLAVLVLAVLVGMTGVFARPILYRSVVGNIIRPDFRGPLTVAELMNTEKVVFSEEGVNATVVVARRQGEVALRTNGKTEASGGEDQETQLTLAYLPLGLLPHPRRVLVIGYGGGATVYAATQFSTVERVDCVEIEPAVLRAAPYLQSINHGSYKDPKVHIILDDARNYLNVTGQTYDVIISEPSYVWSAGVAGLFTREFYRQVQEHLAPEGLFMQWIQGYQMSPDNVATVVRTLGASFPQLSLWRGSPSDFLLLAIPVKQRFRLGPLEAEFAHNSALRSSMATDLYISQPLGLLGYFLLDDAPLRQLAAHGDLNTDDRTVLEFSAPFDIGKHTDALNHPLVRTLRREMLPAFLDLHDPQAAVLAGAETQVRMGALGTALGAPLLGPALTGPPNEERLLLLATWQVSRGHALDALATLRQAEQLAPRSHRVAYNLAQFYLSQGQPDEARPLLEKCLTLAPDYLPALRALEELEESARNWEAALALERRILDAQPPQAYAEWARMGGLYLKVDELQPALDALQKSLDLEPLGYQAHRHLAELLAGNGKTEEAIREYRFLLRYYPTSDATLYVGLARLYRQQGQERQARRTLGKGQRIFPADVPLQQALWQGAGP